jgi:hypothetical protein
MKGSRRDSPHVEPIRLGQWRQRVLSLAEAKKRAYDDKNRKWEPADDEPDLVASVEWENIIRAACLDGFERRIFNAHWRRGVPVSRLAGVLRCTRTKASEGYKRVVQKLRGGAASGCLTLAPAMNSSQPVFRERLASGHRPWSIGRLGNVWRETMQQEKYSLVLQHYSGNFGRSNVFCPFTNRSPMSKALTLQKPAETLQDQLRAARVVFDGLVVKRQAADERMDKLRGLVAELQGAVIRDREDSLLEDRAPDSKLQERYATAEKELTIARDNAAVFEGAINRQRAAVDALEGEIFARRRESFLLATAAIRPEIRALISELGRKVQEYSRVGLEYGQDHLSAGLALYPIDGQDPIAGSSYRDGALKVANTALHLQSWCQWQEASVLAVAEKSA